MRIVIDTTVIFSALYDPASVPGRVIELALEEEIELLAPEPVKEELDRVLREKLGYTGDQWRRTLAALPIDWVEEAVYEQFLPEAREAIRDRDDAAVVALAILLGTGVVSGDGAFHPLEEPVVETWRPRAATDLVED